MNKATFPTFNFTGFVDEYMGGANALKFDSSPVRVYPLSVALEFLKPPTALFKTRYNFLLLFSAGGGTQQIDNETIELRGNDALFIREGHLIAIQEIDPATAGYYVHVDNALLPRIITDKALLNQFSFFPKITVNTAKMEWACRCCELLAQHGGSEEYVREVQVALLKAIFLTLAEAPSGAASQPDRHSEITMLFKELLYENFASERAVKFYADTLSVTQNYLNRCVKAVTQKSPKQHINETVIYHSKVLLGDPEKTISEIAFGLNFSDPSYFGRLFKQITQLTPSEYRGSLRQDSSGKVHDFS